MRAFNGYIYEGTCTDAVEACYYVDTLNDIAGEKLFGFCFDTGHALAASRLLDVSAERILLDRSNLLLYNANMNF